MLWRKLSMFNMHVIVADQPMGFPKEGDQFIMQVLIKTGYTSEALSHLNRVQVSLQLLFMSDILTMLSGNKVCTDILSCQPQGEASSKMKWPHECPTDSDMMLWWNAILSICPSWSHITRIGCFIGRLHRIWRWFWSKAESTLHCRNIDGKTEDVFVSRQKPNRFTHSHV
jgi:hypothetical protein